MENYKSTRQALISVPVPRETKTYKPVSHQELIDLTLSSIDSSGFTLDKELYSYANDGMVANGRFTIKDVADSEMQLEIGWQNSYDKSLSLKFAIGTSIFICKNGCVSGDFGAFRKIHKGEIQTFTPDAITSYIRQAGEAFQRIQKERDAMKQIEVTRRVQAELIGRMFVEETFIQSTQVNILARELKEPTYDYGCKGSLWELYNFTTFAMKDAHPRLWMRRHIDAHTFFNNVAGTITSSAPQIQITPVNQLQLFEADAPNYEV